MPALAVPLGVQEIWISHHRSDKLSSPEAVSELSVYGNLDNPLMLLSARISCFCGAKSPWIRCLPSHHCMFSALPLLQFWVLSCVRCYLSWFSWSFSFIFFEIVELFFISATPEVDLATPKTFCSRQQTNQTHGQILICECRFLFLFLRC